MMNALKYILFMVVSPCLYAAASQSTSHDPVAPILLWVTLILFFALLGRYLAHRLHQPGVLGELIIGVILGNVCYYFGVQLAIVLRAGPEIFEIMRAMLSGASLSEAVKLNIDPHYANEVITVLSGPQGLDLAKTWNILDVFSRFGVIFLLFMVGLESSIAELKHTGRESIQVALIGVLAPILLGFGMAFVLLPTASYKVDLFVAATLAATSVGITARVLAEMKKLRTREAKIILGAAMMDDILGLILLAVVSSLVIYDAVSLGTIFRIVFSAVLFFVFTVMFGPKLLRWAVTFFEFFLETWEVKLFTSFMFTMILAWLATLVDLASIIGAFCAGLILHEGFFKSKGLPSDILNIKQLVAPLESILAPLFFILIGIQVKLESFYDWHVLMLSAGLITAAILGKLLSGLGASRKDDRLLIGMGMLPRGEVGLVFASIGRNLGVISDQLFSAIILMVIVTTCLAPVLLKSRYRRNALKISRERG